MKTTGTEIDKLMPPVSRFGCGNRAQKKQSVIEKLKTFFEKYYGLGITEMQAEEQKQADVYKINPNHQLAADGSVEYGKED